jgi:hypothetical protein
MNDRHLIVPETEKKVKPSQPGFAKAPELGQGFSLKVELLPVGLLPKRSNVNLNSPSLKFRKI